ncbi:NUDIX hydrolase [Neolewinella persica]|uniref:hypothetical protein n=1 Tax=Neolewinella persica TaxID=70998 RepID=UPI00037C7F9E|nr:hypothetical protein [Neolewinella persica]
MAVRNLTKSKVLTLITTVSLPHNFSCTRGPAQILKAALKALPIGFSSEAVPLLVNDFNSGSLNRDNVQRILAAPDYQTARLPDQIPMGLRKTASLIIYRFRERGLEVFMTRQSDEWGLPGGEVDMDCHNEMIELEPSANREEAVAIEGDWHEIPSLKQMLYEESGELAERLKDIEQGAFVTIKEALKHRLSTGQVEFLRELRDVITDRNSLRDI